MFTSQLLMIGTSELLLVAGIALLLFGGKKLPEMMKGLGEGVRSFKDAVNAPSSKTTEDQENKAKKPEDKADNTQENENVENERASETNE